MKRRILAVFLALMLCFPAWPAPSAQAASSLTLDEAIRIVTGASKKKKELLIDRRKKEIELAQARKAVKRYYASRYLIKFSLLFNLSITDQFEGMPKELEMAMAIPRLQTELQDNRAEEAYTARKEKNNVETQFYNIMLSDYNIDFTTKLIADKKKTYDQLSRQLAMGENIDITDVAYVKNEIDALEKYLVKEQLANMQKRDKLGKLLGMELRSGYTLTTTLPELSLSRDRLPDILAYAEKNDFTLNKAVRSMQTAEAEVRELMGMYQSHYGSYVADVNRYIATHKGTMDYSQFEQLYERALYNFDSPWYGSWNINLIFFTIKIPKDWFKLKWDGTRYLKDKPQELFTAAVELNKQIEMEAQVRSELRETVTDLYNVLKELENIRREQADNIQKAEANYSQILKDNQMGLTGFASVESEKTNLKNMQKGLYEANVEYAKALSMLDFYSSGYVTAQMLGESANVSTDYASGQSFLDDDGNVLEGAAWEVVQVLTDYRFSFYIKLPNTVKATHFELYTAEGSQIGNRTAVKDPLVALPITYSETPTLIVKLYNENRLAYTAEIEGTNYSGTLNLVPVTQNTIRIVTGSYEMGMPTTLTCELAITVTDGTDFDAYALYSDVYMIGQAAKGGKIVHLETSFSDMAALSVVLLKNEAAVKRLQLSGSRDGGDLIWETEP